MHRNAPLKNGYLSELSAVKLLASITLEARLKKTQASNRTLKVTHVSARDRMVGLTKLRHFGVSYQRLVHPNFVKLLSCLRKRTDYSIWAQNRYYHGRGDWTRTSDLTVPNRTRYQLCYAPITRL